MVLCPFDHQLSIASDYPEAGERFFAGKMIALACMGIYILTCRTAQCAAIIAMFLQVDARFKSSVSNSLISAAVLNYTVSERMKRRFCTHVLGKISSTNISRL